jgi:hypothetical protein
MASAHISEQNRGWTEINEILHGRYAIGQWSFWLHNACINMLTNAEIL